MILPGLVSITFRKLAPADIVALVARAGLAGIEWGGDIHVPHGDLARAQEVRGLTESAGLAVAAYGSYYKAGHSESAGLAFPTVLATAAALGTPVVRIWAGPAGSEATDATLRQQVLADIRRISVLAAGAGIKVAAEFHAGTLNDGNAMAARLAAEVDHPNFVSYWQPPIEFDEAACLEGLRVVGPRLSHVHVFEWRPGYERRPLAEGAARWARFLRAAAAVPGDRYAMLEYVEADAPEHFLRDAATLRTWLAGLR